MSTEKVSCTGRISGVSAQRALPRSNPLPLERAHSSAFRSFHGRCDGLDRWAFVATGDSDRMSMAEQAEEVFGRRLLDDGKRYTTQDGQFFSDMSHPGRFVGLATIRRGRKVG